MLRQLGTKHRHVHGEGSHSGALCSQEERAFLRAQLGHGHRGQIPQGLMNKNSPSLAREVPELQTVGICEIFWMIPQHAFKHNVLSCCFSQAANFGDS